MRGVVLQFCRLYDMTYDFNYAMDYIDLAALGTIADVIDVRDFETRFIIDEGIRNIKNPFLKAMIKNNSFVFKDGITPTKIAFYIAPLINAVCRIGTYEENEKTFKCFLEENEHLEVETTKRGADGLETLITQMLRETVNIKNRQNRTKEKGIEEIRNIIEEEHLNDNKVLIINNRDLLGKHLNGLVAGQIASDYQKPTLIMKETSEGVLEGSGRGYDVDLRELLDKSGLVNYAAGHSRAFGVSVNSSNIEDLNKFLNQELIEYDGEIKHSVDLIYEGEIPYQDILSLAKLDKFYGHGFEDTIVMVKDLSVVERNITLLEKGPTLKIDCNGVTYIKFRCPAEECKAILPKNDFGRTKLNIIGKCSINNFRDEITPQIIIEDYEIVACEDYYF